MKKWFCFALALPVILAGCNLFNRDFSSGPGVDPTKGSLVLLLDGAALPTQTIVPSGYSMNIVSYLMEFTKPDSSQALEIRSGVALHSFLGLETGDWSVKVHAYNRSITTSELGDPPTVVPTTGLIGSVNGVNAAVPFTITAGGVDTETADILPIVGTGTVDLTLEWTAAAILNPRLAANLNNTDISPGKTDATYGAFGAISGTPTSSTTYNKLLGTGYHKPLILQLYSDPDGDGGNPETVVWGWVESVRVVDGQTSQYAWTLNSDLNGQLTLTTNENMQNPINITFSPATIPNFAASAGLTVSVDAGYSYAWYLDGTELTSGADGVTITANQVVFAGASSKLTVGSHNLSVLVTSGSVVSSNTIPFTVIP